MAAVTLPCSRSAQPSSPRFVSCLSHNVQTPSVIAAIAAPRFAAEDGVTDYALFRLRVRGHQKADIEHWKLQHIIR